MRKLSEINEGMFSGIIRRSNSDLKKEEDKSRFDEPFKIIKNSELIDFGSSRDYKNKVLWTPFNFGSDSIDKPGWYMSKEDIEELREYLKDTDYEIPEYIDFMYFSKYMSESEKIGKQKSFLISDRGNRKLYFPDFGYISRYYDEHNEPETVSPGNGRCVYFGSIHFDKIGYTEFTFNKNYTYSCLFCRFNDDMISDKVQVRLVKKIHK